LTNIFPSLALVQPGRDGQGNYRCSAPREMGIVAQFDADPIEAIEAMSEAMSG
jgi:hypothetical protein